MIKKILRAANISRKEKAVARYMQEVRAIQDAKLTRRELFKMGLTAGVGGLSMVGGRNLLPDFAQAEDVILSSPPCLQPWTEKLPIPKACQPSPGNIFAGPEPHVGQCPEAHRRKNPGHRGNDDLGNEVELDEDFHEARTEDHQKIDQFGGVEAALKYEIMAKEIDWNFYSGAEYPHFNAKVWTYTDLNSDAVGVLRINAHYGQPILMRMYNGLPKDNRLLTNKFGINQICPHLHNAHNPPESDGGPLRFFDPGKWYDFWYPNVRAGFASTHLDGTIYNGHACRGDWQETQSTLWFHDHRLDFTAQNVYKGLASFYTLFSDDIGLDTGDETTGLGLPSGEYDIPILLTDKVFDANGEMFFDLLNEEGILGDQQTVNFKIKPYLEVKRRKYRFRFLDGGPSRFVELFLSNGNKFIRIANDGNLLPRAQVVKSIRLGVAERADVIIDFSQFPSGTEIYLENRLEQLNGKGPTGKILPSGDSTKILKFIVTGDVADESAPLSQLISQTMVPMPDRAANPVVRKRNFSFDTSNGAWTVNGQLFDPSVISAYPVNGTAEEWTLRSGGGWAHPVHIHHEEGQVISRNGKFPALDDLSRKDVYRIGEGAQKTSGTGKLTIYMQFRDWDGDYPMHCHNVVHEDHAMMVRFKIVQPSDPDAGK